jgi:hypothetical protein
MQSTTYLRLFCYRLVKTYRFDTPSLTASSLGGSPVLDGSCSREEQSRLPYQHDQAAPGKSCSPVPPDSVPRAVQCWRPILVSAGRLCVYLSRRTRRTRIRDAVPGRGTTGKTTRKEKKKKKRESRDPPLRAWQPTRLKLGQKLLC